MGEECWSLPSTSGEFVMLIVIRPIMAVSMVSSLITIGWYLAWKTVLVHVPLVQEIFGLRKKTLLPKPITRRRLSKFYNNLDSRYPPPS